jgi:hypothetical protein
MADIHRMNEEFAGAKRDLIISEAAYKFFWDPLGAITQTANALDNGGWAFIGDIQENVSFNFDNLFTNEAGQPIDPVTFFDYLNTLNLGYKFYPKMTTTTSMGDERRILTLAIEKTTNKDINVPVYYGERQKSAGESSWRSPIVYIVPSNGKSPGSQYTQVK